MRRLKQIPNCAQPKRLSVIIASLLRSWLRTSHSIHLVFVSSFSLTDSLHHVHELLETDLAVAIFVNLLHNLVDSSLVKVAAETKDFLDLVGGNNSRAVLVKHLESSLQFVVSGELLLVHGGNHKL
jgi:hypothetical protein